MGMTFLQLLAIFNGFLFMEINGYNLVDQEPKVQCKESEREALLGFKKGFRNHFSYFSSWKPEKDCCQWKRVECNHKTGHVIALNLRGNKENVSEQLQGEITRSLLHLPYLNFPDLSQNDFNQIQIPEFFGSLSSLNYLNLSNSKFKGIILDQLGNLSSLHELDLSANGFSLKSNNLDWVRSLSSLRVLDLGEVDLSNACNWLEAINMLPFLRELRLFACKLHKLPESLPHVNFTSLEILDLSLNSFDCSIPSWLFKIGHSLVELHLRRNQLHGLIPDAFGNMTSLVELDFSENNLQGHVPKSLAKLSRLIVLNFAWNSLEGTVSHVHLLNLSNLRVLELSSNQLAFNVSSNWIPTFQLEIVGLSCCHLGLQFPKWLQTQKSFSFIDISNSGISDIVPNWFWNLSPGVRCMNLSFNGLRGNVPDLSLKSELSLIDLTRNRFSGPVPLFSPKMRVVILSRNLFSGEISNLCEMMTENNSLSYLALSNNLLSGPIPDCWTRGQDLQVLNLASNNLSGKIPGSIGSLVQLKLLIWRTSLHGEIPSALKSCTSLLVLHLGLNNLSGGVPEWIGENLLGLRILGINSNALLGVIPLQLCQLKSLKFLNLSSNHLSGQIPQCVDTLYAMTETGSGCSCTHGLSTLTNGTITKTQLLFPLVFPIVKWLDLSSNNFSGEIPPQVMKLIGLVGLNLSRNMLTGTIPQNIGGMEALGSLDLSWNELSCTIPDSILRLVNLSHLNLSHNKLSGPIPLGMKLSNFDETSYLENQNLCGPPLAKNCSVGELYKTSNCPKMELHSEESGHKLEISSFYISMLLGFFTVLLGFWIPLLLNTSWRRAYFQFLDSTFGYIKVKSSSWSSQIDKEALEPIRFQKYFRNLCVNLASSAKMLVRHLWCRRKESSAP